jgi:hypothetical protein
LMAHPVYPCILLILFGDPGVASRHSAVSGWIAAKIQAFSS